ncbi:RimK/LysX family protein [Pseudomonas sp. ZB1P45]|uniref:putative ATP-dependent zinc protease n=1 Tax=Pseudomonas frigoris TaxID=3398356 RepID=UPI0039EEDFC5
MTNSAGELIAALFASIVFQSAFPAGGHPKVIGWAEEGLIWPERIAVRAKLDTDSSTSSIDVKQLALFKKGDVQWARFNIALKDNNDGLPINQSFEREIVGHSPENQTSTTGKRPIVEMDVCFGQSVYKENFTLDDRSKMLYPMIIGQHLIAKLGFVDASKTFTVEPHCVAIGQ